MEKVTKNKVAKSKIVKTKKSKETESRMKNACELIMLVDRSGSMEACRLEANNAINEFIRTQSLDDVPTYLTLVEFDNVVHTHITRTALDKSSPPTYTLVPRNMTALYDAIGTTVNFVGKRLSELAESDRPDKVIFVIMTDGLENNSKEFKADQIKKMIEHQETKYNWKFIYLGANQDAFAVGGSIGTSTIRTCSYDTQNFGAMCSGVSRSVSDYKSNLKADMAFTDEERAEITQEGSSTNFPKTLKSAKKSNKTT